ncbi:nucleotidyltransferase domain-containing protein [bacterium]|nr:nucleotidyltransferase domain-containing protein [bacterium]
MRIVLFGSRARGDAATSSDMDAGLIPKGKVDRKKIILNNKTTSQNSVRHLLENASRGFQFSPSRSIPCGQSAFCR